MNRPRSLGYMVMLTLGLIALAVLVSIIFAVLPGAIENERRKRMKLETTQEIVRASEARAQEMIDLARKGHIDGLDPYIVPVKR